MLLKLADTVTQDQVMLNSFDILRTKISFLVVKRWVRYLMLRLVGCRLSLVVLVHDLWRFLAVDPHMFLEVT